VITGIDVNKRPGPMIDAQPEIREPKINDTRQFIDFRVVFRMNI
jgi:hypothetical protein